MRRFRISLVAVLLVLSCVPALAQTVRGQILLPDGSTPRQPIRFYLASSDGRTNEYRYTDSNGRFILERLNGLIEWIITAESDGETYATTEHRFIPGNQAPVRFFLNPLPAKEKQAEKTGVALTKPKSPALATYDAAMKKIQEDKLDEAERLLRDAMAADPKLAEAPIALGAVLLQQKKFAEAEKLLRQGLALDPKSAYGHMSLGILMNRTNHFAEAIPSLREAIKLNKDLASPHLHLGVALVETEQYAEAEHELDEAQGVTGTEDVIRHLYLGQLFARTGRYEKAIASFETYLQKSPKAANAGDVRALIERMKQELAAKR